MTERDFDPAATAQVLAFALEHYPEKVAMLPVSELLMDSARQNDKRPAYIKLAVPDEMVQGLRGKKATDLLVLVSVPQETTERAESPIILPGEVG